MYDLRKKATVLSTTDTERFYKRRACRRVAIISIILILTLVPAFTQINAGHAASSKPKPPAPLRQIRQTGRSHTHSSMIIPRPTASGKCRTVVSLWEDHANQGRLLRPAMDMRPSSGSTRPGTYNPRPSTPTRDTLNLPR